MEREKERGRERDTGTERETRRGDKSKVRSCKRKEKRKLQFSNVN